MKATHIVTAAAVVLAAAGAARGDFVLSGTQHLDVTTSHGTGNLWDSSTADVLAGGYISGAHVNNGARLRVLAYYTDGIAVDDLTARDTSRVEISGGVRSLVAYQTSSVDMTGGSVSADLRVRDSSSVDISGGGVFRLHADNTSSVAISGGSVFYLYADDTSGVDISGGSVLSSLWARDTSTVTFHGYDFRAKDGLSLDGDKVLGTGLLTGKWFDGTAWAIPILTHDSGATILAVPEPATLSVLALGCAAIIRRRRRVTPRSSLGTWETPSSSAQP